MTGTKIHHMMSAAGRAACGQNLGYVDQGGEVGGDLPPRTWDVYHVAESAVGLLKWIDQYGAADVCWSCSLEAQAAATNRGAFRLGLAPAWAEDRLAFSSRVALTWPLPADEAAMSEDEWAMRRPTGSAGERAFREATTPYEQAAAEAQWMEEGR